MFIAFFRCLTFILIVELICTETLDQLILPEKTPDWMVYMNSVDEVSPSPSQSNDSDEMLGEVNRSRNSFMTEFFVENVRDAYNKLVEHCYQRTAQCRADNGELVDHTPSSSLASDVSEYSYGGRSVVDCTSLLDCMKFLYVVLDPDYIHRELIGEQKVKSIIADKGKPGVVKEVRERLNCDPEFLRDLLEKAFQVFDEGSGNQTVMGRRPAMMSAERVAMEQEKNQAREKRFRDLVIKFNRIAEEGMRYEKRSSGLKNWDPYGSLEAATVAWFECAVEKTDVVAEMADIIIHRKMKLFGSGDEVKLKMEIKTIKDEMDYMIQTKSVALDEKRRVQFDHAAIANILDVRTSQVFLTFGVYLNDLI